MRGYMFRNRWFALLFVAMTLAGVTKLVGTGDDKGTIQQAAGEIAAQRAQADQFSAPPPAAEPVMDDVPYASDDDLIDSASGEDPTPVDEFVDPSEAEGGPEDVTIVSRDEPQADPAAAGAETDLGQ